VLLQFFKHGKRKNDSQRPIRKYKMKTLIRIVNALLIIILFSNGHNIDARRVASLHDFYKVPFLARDNKQIYISDQVLLKIVIYSGNDFKKIKEFGRKGEGPAEFFGIANIEIDDHYLYINSFPKLCIFTKDGDLKKEIRCPTEAGSFIPCGGNYIGIIYPRTNPFELKGKKEFSLYDSDLEKIIDIYDAVFNKVSFYKNKSSKEMINRINGATSAWCYDGKIFIGEPDKGYLITVFDNKGKKLYEIRKALNPRKITEEEKKANINQYRKHIGESRWKEYTMRCESYFTEYYPAFENCSVNNDKIYIFEFPRDDKRDIQILDLKGNSLRKITIAENPYFTGIIFFRRYYIYNGKFYYVLENQDEEQWEIHEIDLDNALIKKG